MRRPLNRRSGPIARHRPRSRTHERRGSGRRRPVAPPRVRCSSHSTPIIRTSDCPCQWPAHFFVWQLRVRGIGVCWRCSVDAAPARRIGLMMGSRPRRQRKLFPLPGSPVLVACRWPHSRRSSTRLETGRLTMDIHSHRILPPRRGSRSSTGWAMRSPSSRRTSKCPRRRGPAGEDKYAGCFPVDGARVPPSDDGRVREGVSDRRHVWRTRVSECDWRCGLLDYGGVVACCSDVV